MILAMVAMWRGSVRRSRWQEDGEVLWLYDQLSLRSATSLPHGLRLDLRMRRAGALPTPGAPAYAELGGRLGSPATRSAELSMSGFNHHLEFGAAVRLRF